MPTTGRFGLDLELEHVFAILWLPPDSADSYTIAPGGYTEGITIDRRGPTHERRPRRWPSFYHVSAWWTSGVCGAKISVRVEDKRIYIREAAQILNRRMGTLRKWEQLGVLPKHLRSHRGERNWRFWTPEQIEGIKKWIRDTDRRPGKALPHYHPTEKELDKAIDALRRPHSTTRPRMEDIELSQ